MSRLDPIVDPKPVRRVEIITGEGRRRWSKSEKAAIIEETLAPGAVISVVARRRGLSPQQLFTWRRAARRKMTSAVGLDAQEFVRAVIEAVAKSFAGGAAVGSASRAKHVIELKIKGASVWVWRDADAAMVTAIVDALKAGA